MERSVCVFSSGVSGFLVAEIQNFLEGQDFILLGQAEKEFNSSDLQSLEAISDNSFNFSGFVYFNLFLFD